MRSTKKKFASYVLITAILIVSILTFTTNPDALSHRVNEFIYMSLIVLLLFVVLRKDQQLGQTKEAEQRLTTLINSIDIH